MNETKIHMKIEVAFYILIAAVAACLRLWNLGAAPLSDSESSHALVAAEGTLDASPFWTSDNGDALTSPAYNVLTKLIFQFFGTSDAAARVVPALAGLALVFTPILIRNHLGAPLALVNSALFAISPSLITTARTAGGASLASLSITLTLALLLAAKLGADERVRIGWAAAALGLALASGPNTFHGLLTLSIAAILFIAGLRPSGQNFARLWDREARWSALIVAIVMLAIAGGLGFDLKGLARLAEAFASWISGWGSPTKMPILTAIAILPVYELLVFVFGVVGAIAYLREKNPYGVMATSWAITAVVVMVVYPGRQASDVTWVVIPMATLASRAIVGLVERIAARRSWLEFIGLTFFLLMLMVFYYLQLAAYASGIGPPIDVLNRGIRLWMSAGVLLLGIVVVVLFGLGWNWSLAGESAGVSSGLALLALTISMIWRLNFPPLGANAQELWRPQASTSGLQMMVKTLETISQSQTGLTTGLELDIRGETTPSLAWAMRAFPPAQISADEPEVSAPAIITRDVDVLASPNVEYMGQELEIGERWDWQGPLPPDLISWWVLHQAPTVPESWLLLIRHDVASLGEIE